jgi:RNA polymerase sigma-70 factor, ECF subfamily
MEPLHDLDRTGQFDARYSAFLETVTHLRPQLPRYCARMTGSILDGEDVVQEVLFEAYRKLDQYDESRALGPWLFGIAHNRCIDFLRRRGVREEAEGTFAEADIVEPVDPPGGAIDRAIERLVVYLPPKERACVLLKDVFDYSLEEIAGLVDSAVGGVKSALNRGRAKLAKLPEPQLPLAPPSEDVLQLLRLYIERFNRRDWSGVRELVSADARLRVADCFAGKLSDAPYFSEWDRAPTPWRMALGNLDGETVVLILRLSDGGWRPAEAIRVRVASGHIARITDYFRCSWILPAASSVTLIDEGASPPVS